MANLKEVFYILVCKECEKETEKKWKEFNLWAFGQKIPPSMFEVPDRWNEMRPEYEIEVDFPWLMDCKKMINLWMESEYSHRTENDIGISRKLYTLKGYS